MSIFIPLVYGITIPILVAIAVFAIYLSYIWRSRNQTQEDFLTARKQISTAQSAWGFFASAVGAWVVASPASYASYAGWIGLVFYSISAGLPVIMIAFVGGYIHKKMPNVLSAIDFIGWRYGYIPKTFVMLIMLLNMCIALLAEYVTIGSLFQAYLGSVDYPIIIVVGTLTMIYTAYGGLLVSVVTDQIQSSIAVFISVIVAIYLASQFRAPLMSPIPDYVAGTTVSGYSSIFVMPVSLFTATAFSEALWQRAWAAQSDASLRLASVLGAIGITLLTFLFGLMGLLATWAGLIDFQKANANLYAFYALPNAISSEGTVSNWIGVLIIILASVMNMGAVDSLQNGISGTITTWLLSDEHARLISRNGKAPVWWTDSMKLNVTRVCVFLVNAALIIATVVKAAMGEPLEVLSLFLVANMIACACAIPMLISIYSRIEPYFGGFSMLLSCITSFFFTSLYGVSLCWNREVVYDSVTLTYECVPLPKESFAHSLSAGLTYAWYRNNYRWDFFLISICVSAGTCMLCIGVQYLMKVMLKYDGISLFGFRPLRFDSSDFLSQSNPVAQMSAISDAFDPSLADDGSHQVACSFLEMSETENVELVLCVN